MLPSLVNTMRNEDRIGASVRLAYENGVEEGLGVGALAVAVRALAVAVRMNAVIFGDISMVG